MGSARTALFLVQRLLLKLSFGTVALHLFYLYVQPVRGKPLLSERWRAGLEVRPVARDEADKVAFVQSLAEVTARLERGDLCLAAHRGDDVVGYFWLAFGPFDESEVRCRFVPTPADRVGWDYDLHVPPRERGGVVFAALWDGANAALGASGRAWTASQVSAFNGASIRAHRGLGAQRVGSVLFLCLGPVQLTVATVAPFLHLSLRAGAAPTIVVAAPEEARAV